MKGTASGSSRSKTKVSVSLIFNMCFKCNTSKQYLTVVNEIELLIHAFISLSMDYCNFLFTCLNKSSSHRLQFVLKINKFCLLAVCEGEKRVLLEDGDRCSLYML